jgi:hypothetical protein
MALPTMSGYDAFGVGSNQSSERSKLHPGQTGNGRLPLEYALRSAECIGARYTIAASMLSPCTTVSITC